MRRKELTLDPRTQADLCRRVEELAASYTPEWRFDRSDPDVGSTLAMIFADQMAGNIRRMNQLPEKYHTEFVNLLGLNLKPAYPASGIAVVDLMRGTVPGVELPRGTRLMTEGEDGVSVLFETMGDVYLTNARLTDILSISGTKGRIRPLLGGPKPARLVPVTQEAMQAAGEADESAAPEGSEGAQGVSFAMFDYEEPGVECNALLLYHQSVFGNKPGIPIQISAVTPEGKSLAGELTDSARWRWSYCTAQGLEPFAEVEEENGLILLRRDGESVGVKVDGREYHLICLEALEPVRTSVDVADIRLASRKDSAAPQLMLRNGEELDAALCMPMGDTASVFEECYICDEQVFAQQDAMITLSFDLSSRKKMLQLTAQQEYDELKVVRRKATAIQYKASSAALDRVVAEYYDGHLWRRLPGSQDWETLFDGTHSGPVQLTFQCPADWAPVPINGYEGRCMRFRVTQADNCYLLPCEHTMPVLRDVAVSYTYDGVWKQPQKLCTVSGTRIQDQTKALLNGGPVTIFRPLFHPAASLYLGFDRPLEGAPVSMLFDVEESVHFRMEPVVFEYSTRTGFKQMKVIDGPENFSGSGIVLFMPPADFAPTEVEGVKRWWLRLSGGERAVEGYHPLIHGITLNAVEIQNRLTHPEESFYVDTAVPNMTFHLAAQNILSAEVFVNEMGRLSRYQMREMLDHSPNDVRAEYDFMGEITAFFVRWTEVDSFDHSAPNDRHYRIDRSRNTLVFGDGVHVRIPQAQRGAAVLVRAVSCDGARGNVPAGAISGFYGNVMYVEGVRNPVATYAGSNLEDLDSARRRGAEMLCSRGNLISEIDFARAVKSFSDTVEKVKCLAGRDLDGQDRPERITIAVMTRDYADGAYAFKNICAPLKRMLMERCDAMVTPECLVLAEPVYVDISVSVWVKVDDAAGAFDVQNLILDSIRSFLEPLSKPGHSGWEIGSLPTENQLKMLLQSLRFRGHIERMIAVARYVDKDGVHEVGLDQLPDTPFAIGVNGEHKIHIAFS